MAAPALDLDREALRVLVIAVGAREAARQTGINPNTVLALCRRHNWLSVTKPTPAIMPLPASMQPIALNALTPANALLNTLSDERNQTKAAFSRNSLRVAKHLDTLQPDEIMDRAGNLRDLVTVAEKSQDWQSGQQQVTVNIFEDSIKPADAIEI